VNYLNKTKVFSSIIYYPLKSNVRTELLMHFAGKHFHLQIALYNPDRGWGVEGKEIAIVKYFLT
jgi:hypothetical protein